MVKWFVYMLSCSDNSIYTGITTNVSRRINEHNTKKGAKSLFGKLPVVLVYKESCSGRIEAARRESEIKGWNHLEKIALINNKP